MGITIFGLSCIKFNKNPTTILAIGGFFCFFSFMIWNIGFCGVSHQMCKTKTYTPMISVKKNRKIKKLIVNSDKNANCDCYCGCCYDLKCNQPPNDYGIVGREMRMLRVSKDDIVTAVNENYSIPPSPKITGIGFHWVKHFRSKERTFTENIKMDIPYASWQEEGQPAFPKFDKPITVYYCTTEYVFEQGMEQAIHNVRVAVKAQLNDVSRFTFVDDETIGITSEILYSKHCCAKLCNNCFTSCCLFNIFSLFGWGYVIETIWRQLTEVVFFKSVKRISAYNNLRVRAGERDHMPVTSNDFSVSEENIIKQSLT